MGGARLCQGRRREAILRKIAEAGGQDHRAAHAAGRGGGICDLTRPGRERVGDLPRRQLAAVAWRPGGQPSDAAGGVIRMGRAAVHRLRIAYHVAGSRSGACRVSAKGRQSLRQELSCLGKPRALLWFSFQPYPGALLPPTRVCDPPRTSPRAEDDSEFRNVTRPASSTAYVPGCASRRISASDCSGPGHSSRISCSPLERTKLRRMSATMIASSSCPATGMKSGTRSNGNAR
jgi:hypothetical protein